MSDTENALEEYKNYCKTDVGQRAELYDKKYPYIWEAFKDCTSQVRARGILQYSAKAIFERIRWHMTIERGDKDFKICNTYTAYYARKMMCLVGYEGFFSIRDHGGRVPCQD